ncbi:hypothetical protein ACFX11_017589 [Malus domestica]
MPNLEHLELEHLELRFSKVSSKGFALVSIGCPNLEYLDLFGCVNLTGQVIENATSNLKNLKEIKKPNFYIPLSVFHTECYRTAYALAKTRGRTEENYEAIQ